MTDVEVRMSDEAGRHFIGPVPAERECAGRNFRIITASKDANSVTIFRCIRCNRELEGQNLPDGKSRLSRPGGHIS
jgi:hypothetical protein